jgi:undecaprenyl diphosphate synthase
MVLSSIAFIPDGNRRFAMQSGINFLKAYQLGTKKAWDVMHWLEEYPNVRDGTFWMLSLENMQKRKAELSVLFKIFDRELEKVKKSGYFEANQVRLRFFGKIEMLPNKLVEKISKAEQFTADFKKKTINLALGYSGRMEIVDAAKKLAADLKENKIGLGEVNENSFKKYLYAAFPDPDLIIRTSGAMRLSGFLPYQSAYSELYFCNHYWPEFSQQDLRDAIGSFEERQRNFGK